MENDAAVATAAATFNDQEANPPPKPTVSKFYRMAKGYVRYKPGATYEERRLYWQRVQWNPKLKDETKRPASDCWLFFNKNLMGKAMHLFASQAIKLAELLPQGFDALQQQDTSFCATVSESKTQRLTLEVHTYKDNLQLSLRKYYKPEDKADDEEQDWIITGSHMTFDPELDDPEALLDYVLATSDM